MGFYFYHMANVINNVWLMDIVKYTLNFMDVINSLIKAVVKTFYSSIGFKAK